MKPCILPKLRSIEALDIELLQLLAEILELLLAQLGHQGRASQPQVRENIPGISWLKNSLVFPKRQKTIFLGKDFGMSSAIISSNLHIIFFTANSEKYYPSLV